MIVFFGDDYKIAEIWNNLRRYGRNILNRDLLVLGIIESSKFQLSFGHDETNQAEIILEIGSQIVSMFYH